MDLKPLYDYERAITPEERLFSVVILDGFRQAMRGRQEDADWLFLPSDPNEKHTFGWYCRGLGLDPKQARERLREIWRKGIVTERTVLGGRINPETEQKRLARKHANIWGPNGQGPRSFRKR